MLISNHKYSRPYKRKLHLSDGIWSYRVVGTFVAIRSPDGKKTIKTDIYEINNTTYEEYMSQYDNEYPSSVDLPHSPDLHPKDIILFLESKNEYIR